MLHSKQKRISSTMLSRQWAVPNKQEILLCYHILWLQLGTMKRKEDYEMQYLNKNMQPYVTPTTLQLI